MFTGVRSIRSVVVLLSVVAALAASVGCAATRPPDHAAEVRLSLDSATYARGEPVRAAVSVTNVGACDLLVPSLDNDGLKFRRGRPGVGELLVRRPHPDRPASRRSWRALGAAAHASRAELDRRAKGAAAVPHPRQCPRAGRTLCTFGTKRSRYTRTRR